MIFLSLLLAAAIHLANGIASRLWCKEPNDWDSLANGIDTLSYQQIWMSGRASHQCENMRPVTCWKFHPVPQNQNHTPVPRLGKGQPGDGALLQRFHFIWGTWSLRSSQTTCFSTSILFSQQALCVCVLKQPAYRAKVNSQVPFPQLVLC